MARDSQFAVQDAIHDTLKADAGVIALVSTRVYDHVPQNEVFPYIALGEATGDQFDDKAKGGMSQVITIHTWSRYRGSKETKQIMGAVVAALDRANLSVTGHDLAWIRFTFSDLFIDPDGFTRHGVQNFEVVTQAA